MEYFGKTMNTFKLGKPAVFSIIQYSGSYFVGMLMPIVFLFLDSHVSAVNQDISLSKRELKDNKTDRISRSGETF